MQGRVRVPVPFVQRLTQLGLFHVGSAHLFRYTLMLLGGMHEPLSLHVLGVGLFRVIEGKNGNICSTVPGSENS